MSIFAKENKKWKDLSSLQPRKKMLKTNIPEHISTLSVHG